MDVTIKKSIANGQWPKAKRLIQVEMILHELFNIPEDEQEHLIEKSFIINMVF